MTDSARLSEPAGLEVRITADLAGAEGAIRLDFRVTIRDGEFVALCGPSGAGKTSVLRMIAGLQRPGSGRIAHAGHVWSDDATGTFRPVRERSIGFVFQDYALFPNMTARGNVEYALADLPRSQRRAEARRLLGLVGLSALELARPAQLSGGQKQRLALIRSLARRPALLMLDEPLSALDPEMRMRMRGLLASLHDHFGATTLMVSHDPEEIEALADRVIRLRDGRIEADERLRSG
ncbi:MAG: ABC transporter ATP-binding protein [Tropicimonas sp.]|uniref:ABC transporter ATP-binding protein n=1 Tax=Tropicimonas sp. TaxID=2067044 RepID=UPI003A86042D